MVVCLASAAVVGIGWVFVHIGDPNRKARTYPSSSGQPESRDSLAEVLLPRDARDTALARRPGEEVSDTDALIAGITGQRAYHRIQELMQRRDLSEAECEALCAFLAERTGNEYLERTASIKNSVMNVLAGQERLPAPWDQVLLKMFHDQEQHPVIRDYALQHLFSHYESMLEDAVDAAWHPLSRSGLLDEFWAAAAQVDQQSAGTALLGLLHLSGVEPAVEVDRLRRRSLDVLEDPQASELAKISSLQVCASLGEPRAVDWAEAAAGAGQSIALRVSATAALGALGNPAHRQMLDPLTRDENPSVRTAANAALRVLDERHGGKPL
jgi:hypothetical protein